MSTDFILGKDAKLYIGTAGAVIGAMTEVANVKDLGISKSTSKIDVSTRASGAYKAQAPGQAELGLTWGMVWKPADIAFQALRNASLNNTTVELAALDGDKAVSGKQGPKGRFYIDFDADQPLDGAIGVNVTATLETFDEWIEVGA
ncbi:MAG TPA: hypothetical protein VMY35_02740 [Phycisphaerae bacterium]|nr:hypothetical protein [Phycisphaerae bacterium]